MRRDWRPGSLALVVFGLLAVERFLIELIRAKDDRIFYDTFTVAQLISVLILIALAAVAWRRRQGKKAARSAT